MIPGLRGSKASKYIFFETLPTFLMGLLIFLSIILMFQILRLTEFALIHGVQIYTLAEIIGYICISMLPALLPMSLLFSILLTYSRLSNDSEIVAMKAAGISMSMIAFPGLLLSIILAGISARTTFDIAPWGNRQFETIFSKIGNTKAAASIKSGTFSEGFFDMVVYANTVNSEKNELFGVFIYDEQPNETPLTIIARSGKLIPDPELPGHRVLLRLFDGDIHRKGETHTKISFQSYDLRLVDPIKDIYREKSAPSLSLNDIKEKLLDKNQPPDKIRTLRTEYHKRWAVSALCPIFALLGIGLGARGHGREKKTGGMVLSILLIIIYWVFYLTFEGFARSGDLDVVMAVWTPNFIFLILGLESLRRSWK